MKAPFNLDIRSIIFGVIFACVLGIGAVVALFFFAESQIRSESLYHEVALSNGKFIKITACNFAWGIEHDDRHNADDTFVMEYVSSLPHSDLNAVDQETLDVFELIRPTSELWNLKTAEIAAFPTTQRKGRYFRYYFSRDSNGKWNFERKSEKVFSTDL